MFEGRVRIRALYQGLLAEFGAIDKGESPGISVDALQVRRPAWVIFAPFMTQ